MRGKLLFLLCVLFVRVGDWVVWVATRSSFCLQILLHSFFSVCATWEGDCARAGTNLVFFFCFFFPKVLFVLFYFYEGYHLYFFFVCEPIIGFLFFFIGPFIVFGNTWCSWLSFFQFGSVSFFSFKQALYRSASFFFFFWSSVIFVSMSLYMHMSMFKYKFVFLVVLRIMWWFYKLRFLLRLTNLRRI